MPKSTVSLAIDIKPSILLGLIDTAIRVLNFTTLFPLRPMPVMRAEKRSAKRLADLDSHSREGPSARKREIKGNGSVSGQIKCKDLPCTSTNGRCPMTSPWKPQRIKWPIIDERSHGHEWQAPMDWEGHQHGPIYIILIV